MHRTPKSTSMQAMSSRGARMEPRAATPERRVIVAGATDYNYCEVKDGLREGEVVLLEKPAKS